MTVMIWNNNSNLIVTALDLNVHLQSKNEITTKLERHDEFLRDECAVTVSMEGFLEFTNHTLQYGFELLNVSLILFADFADKYSRLVVDNIISDIGQKIEDNYMLSHEYMYLVQSDLFGEESESLEVERFLDKMALKQQKELSKLANLEKELKHFFVVYFIYF